MKIWFITGCSRGFGRVFVRAVLREGDAVFATARKLADIQDLVAQAPDRCEVGQLDVTDTDSVQEAVEQAIARFGRIDVLVNNAGFGVVGPIEAISDRQARHIFDTNFFGTLNVTRAVLPHMRGQRSGHVIQVSSSHAWGAGPGIGMYSATKCAMEGASETMARELSPLGIRLTILQPGPYKTDFLGDALIRAEIPIPDYAPVTQGIEKAVAESHGQQPGDPEGVAAAMIAIANTPTPPLRLLLGKVATERADEKMEDLQAELAHWRPMALASDFAPEAA